MKTAPSLFVGHGSPRDTLIETEAARGWRAVAKRIGRPSAILCISAHWETKGILITRAERPRIIHDFYGFPDHFYAIDYPVLGDPALADRIENRLDTFRARADRDSWGLDHGSWTVLRWMYPKADVPVLQLSLDLRRSAKEHFALGQAIAGLRDEGVMILGSGNIVHNLQVSRPRGDETFSWAGSFDDIVIDRIIAGDLASLVDYRTLPDAASAVPESEHFLPLLYVLGAARPGEPPQVFNRQVLASVSMTCVGYGIPD